MKQKAIKKNIVYVDIKSSYFYQPIRLRNFCFKGDIADTGHWESMNKTFLIEYKIIPILGSKYTPFGRSASAIIKNWITGLCNSRVFIGLAIMGYEILYIALQII